MERGDEELEDEPGQEEKADAEILGAVTHLEYGTCEEIVKRVRIWVTLTFQTLTAVVRGFLAAADRVSMSMAKGQSCHDRGGEGIKRRELYHESETMALDASIPSRDWSG